MTTRNLSAVIMAFMVLAAASHAQETPKEREGLNAPKNPLLCPAEEHPELAEVHERRRRAGLVTGAKWVELEKELDALRKRGRMEGDVVTHLEGPLHELSEGVEPASLDGWCRESRRHWALLVRGLAGIDWAWKARGHGYSSTVSDQSARVFAERLSAARIDLEEAVRRDKGCVEALKGLISVAMGLGQPEDEARSIFERAVKADPTHLPAYTAMANYLLPRWFGTPEKLFGFVEKAIADHPQEPGLQLVACYAHELVEAGGAHYRTPEVLRQVLASADLVLACYLRCAEAWRRKGQACEGLNDQAGRYEAFFQAAECGDLTSMWAVAHHEVFNPHTVPESRRDIRVGLRHLCRAAHFQQAEAMMMLGQAFSRSLRGIPADFAVAVFWYRLAVSYARDEGLKNLARVSTVELVALGLAPPQHGEEVLRKLTNAHEAGYLDATAWLGKLLVEGHCVPADPARGQRLLQEAYDNDNMRATAFIGEMRCLGQVMQKEVTVGSRELSDAARKGDAHANLVLGRWARRQEDAVRHLREAWRLGDPEAAPVLRAFFEKNPMLRGPYDLDPAPAPTPR